MWQFNIKDDGNKIEEKLTFTVTKVGKISNDYKKKHVLPVPMY